MKKEYIEPQFEYRKITYITDVLSDSHPGGGHWGNFDQETTSPYDPTSPTDDFDWDEF